MQWVDGRTAFFLNVSRYESTCVSYIPVSGNIKALDCHQSNKVDVVCEFDKYYAHSKNDAKANSVSSIAIGFDDTIWKVSMIQCPSGHVTRDIMSCDTQGQCGSQKNPKNPHQSGSDTVPMFVCERHSEALHYTLVCDHIHDEDFCQYALCPWFR